MDLTGLEKKILRTWTLREIADDCMLELKELEWRTHNLLVKQSSLSALFEIRKCSTLDRLCRITELVLKFVDILKSYNQ